MATLSLKKPSSRALVKKPMKEGRSYQPHELEQELRYRGYPIRTPFAIGARYYYKRACPDVGVKQFDRWLAWKTKQPEYLKALTVEAFRYDADGKAVMAVKPAHRERATEMLRPLLVAGKGLNIAQ